MTGIAEWLASIGLGEYADRFRENAIDLSVVRDLTEQDLKDLGVLLGHRRKILRAIADLQTELPRIPRTGSGPAPTDNAGRRQLTVMFCDLVGSSALSARLGPPPRPPPRPFASLCTRAHIVRGIISPRSCNDRGQAR